MTAPSPDDVLEFWLGELDDTGRASDEIAQRWWRKSQAFDTECNDRFAETHAAIARGDLESWLDTPRGRVAYVIVLDQLSRNMFRGDAKMYSADPLALEAALDGVDAGVDKQLGYHERYFLYMPLMHAEDLALQERCIALFRSLGDDFPDQKENAAKAVDFAERHRDIVARFGRFPHRNAILGRPDTPEESAFLEEPNSGF